MPPSRHVASTGPTSHVTSKRNSFETAVLGLAAAGFAGANVTTPHKEAAAALADTYFVSVNTLVFEDGRIRGHSTDAAVARRVAGRAAGRARRRRCRAGIPGGAARSADLLPARRVAARCRATPTSSSTRPRNETKCSSSSARVRRSSTCPIPRRRRRAAAREAGAKVIDGLEVLVAQGAAAFEIWTGVPAPVEVMRRAVGLSS